MKKTTSLCFTLITFLMINQSCKKETGTSTIPATVVTSDALEDASATTDTTLLCYLPFKGNLRDKSGHNNNGALMGTISYVPDRFGNASGAASFAVSNTWIEIPEAQFVGLKNMTIAMDFFPTSAGRQLLLSKITYNQDIYSSSFSSSLVLVIEQQNFYPIQFNSKKEGYCNSPYDADWNTTINSNTNFVLNQWNHIAVTFNNSVQKMYLNGVLVATGTKVSSPICQAEPIRLGVWFTLEPLYFTGNMDEVRIYNRVLSAKEIKQLSTK